MYITSRFMGVRIYDNKYLFFVLTDDYYQSQKKMATDLDGALKSFARDLDKGSLVVKASEGDERNTKIDALGKDWTKAQESQISKVPGILVIGEDFDKFNPREHHWYYFSLQDIITESGEIEIHKLISMLKKFSEASKRDNLFDITDEIAHERTMEELYDAFEFKPTAFGLSFDVKKGIEFFKRILEEHKT